MIEELITNKPEALKISFKNSFILSISSILFPILFDLLLHQNSS